MPGPEGGRREHAFLRGVPRPKSDPEPLVLCPGDIISAPEVPFKEPLEIFENLPQPALTPLDRAVQHRIDLPPGVAEHGTLSLDLRPHGQERLVHLGWQVAAQDGAAKGTVVVGQQVIESDPEATQEPICPRLHDGRGPPRHRRLAPHS